MFIANAVAEIEVNASDDITGDDDIEDDDVVIDENHDVHNVDHEPSRDIVSLDSAESDSVTVACSSTTKNSSLQLPYVGCIVFPETVDLVRQWVDNEDTFQRGMEYFMNGHLESTVCEAGQLKVSWAVLLHLALCHKSRAVLFYLYKMKNIIALYLQL